MTWLAGIVIVSALLSLWSGRQAKRNLRADAAAYEDLADYTGFWNRDQLRVLPGVYEDADGELRFDPRQLHQLPQRRVKKILDSTVGDVVSLVLGLAALLEAAGGRTTLWLLLVVAAVYQFLGWVWATWEVWRHGDVWELLGSRAFEETSRIAGSSGLAASPRDLQCHNYDRLFPVSNGSSACRRKMMLARCWLAT